MWGTNGAPDKQGQDRVPRWAPRSAPWAPSLLQQSTGRETKITESEAGGTGGGRPHPHAAHVWPPWPPRPTPKPPQTAPPKDLAWHLVFSMRILLPRPRPDPPAPPRCPQTHEEDNTPNLVSKRRVGCATRSRGQELGGCWENSGQ